MKTRASASSYRQGGFSLLEVLITVLVFSIGLLGLAGLQIIALKSNQNAISRSIASSAAYDMIDLLRAQSRQVNTISAGGNCADTAKIKGYSELSAHVNSALPNGSITCKIAGASLSVKTATVVVSWQQASVAESTAGTATFEQAGLSENVEKVTVVGQL